MITQADIQNVFDELQGTIQPCAKARYDLVFLESMTKSVKAKIQREKQADGFTAISAQEREAYADDRYEKHILGLAAAEERWQSLMMRRKDLHAKIDAWRTQEASMRGMDRIG